MHHLGDFYHFRFLSSATMAALSLLLASALGQHGIPAACKYPPQFTTQVSEMELESMIQ